MSLRNGIFALEELVPFLSEQGKFNSMPHIDVLQHHPLEFTQMLKIS